MKKSISVVEAQKTIFKTVQRLETEKRPLQDALSYVLAEDINARFDLPRFTNSAMDGYAVRSGDLRGASIHSPVQLDLIETIPAGYKPKRRLSRGQAIAVMTGSQIPHGADAVVVVEKTSRNGKKVAVYESVKMGANIRNEGEIIRKGKTVIGRGTIISPREIGVISTFNTDHVKVYRKPRVAIFSTGDEIISLGSKLSPEKIVDSNRHMIVAELKHLGLDTLDVGIISDRKRSIGTALQKSARRADVVITIGGVSMGEFDFVRKGIERLGRLIFWKVRMKPGGPQAFGTVFGKPVFGLPGNPVSTFVIFRLFVLPALRKMWGAQPEKMEGLPRQGKGKWHFGPVKFPPRKRVEKINALHTRGSHDLLSWLDADGMGLKNPNSYRYSSPTVFPLEGGR